MTYSRSSRNPTDDNSLSGVLHFTFNKFLENFIDDMLPAAVVAFDRAKNVATVQPLINRVSTSGEIITPAEIKSVPVYWLGAGGFIRNDPLKPGDLGWLKSCDRDISIFKKLFKLVSPNTKRKHSFADGVFFPAIMTGFIIASEDVNCSVWQNGNGASKVALGDNFLRIKTAGVGIGGTPASGAILDVQSTTQAFVFPRMSTSQKNAIAAQDGYAVYDTTLGRLSVHQSGAWT